MDTTSTNNIILLSPIKESTGNTDERVFKTGQLCSYYILIKTCCRCSCRFQCLIYYSIYSICKLYITG